MKTRLTLLCVPANAALRAGRFPNHEPLEPAQGAAAASVAAALGAAIGHVDRVLRSPMPCARDTARALHLEANIDDALREIDYARWAGLALKDVAASEADALARWLVDPHMDAHGGESICHAIARVGRWADRVSAGIGTAGTGDTVGDAAGTAGHTLVITHASVIKAALIHALKAPPTAYWQLDIAPLSITTLSAYRDSWRVTSMSVPLAHGG
ncbi:histidine phosphatase family protein [Cupriavidus pauculus]|uniref:histidine phosphatase family protein n=1 Tax=Cupriavidus pauculus TaxID=82633 RepID=UPI000785BD05|nr:histidine phosphatase family protein [Cupriavidus pauculus]MBY4729532.1 histidine phosphatase family protein [Cupriavidus pauculus]